MTAGSIDELVPGASTLCSARIGAGADLKVGSSVIVLSHKATDADRCGAAHEALHGGRDFLGGMYEFDRGLALVSMQDARLYRWAMR